MVRNNDLNGSYRPLNPETVDLSRVSLDRCSLLETSPLYMMSGKEMMSEFHQFVTELTEARHMLERTPEREVELTISYSRVMKLKNDFTIATLEGEEQLHKLTELVATDLFSSGRLILPPSVDDRLYTRSSVVVYREADTGETRIITEDVTDSDLYQVTDLELAMRAIREEGCELVCNTVQYHGHEEFSNSHRVKDIYNRVKADEEIFNKLVDEIFEIDKIYTVDKQRGALSNYIKDVFGLKIVVDSEDPQKLYGVLDALRGMKWGEDRFEDGVVLFTPEHSRLKEAEVKDYIKSPKKSGWQGLKAVYKWGHAVFEVQIQSQESYNAERSNKTTQSHSAYRQRREEFRRQVARDYPLYGHYREMLKWLFVESSKSPPEHSHLKIRLVD